jgi:hypothetical protein
VCALSLDFFTKNGLLVSRFNESARRQFILSVPEFLILFDCILLLCDDLHSATRNIIHESSTNYN